MPLGKLAAVAKAGAPLAAVEEVEKRLRVIAESLQGAVERLRSEPLAKGDVLHIAGQFVEAVVADLDAEVLAGHLLDLVSFVEDHRLVVGYDRGVIAFAQRKVSEKQVVVDDDDVGLGRPLVHASNEATLELLALLAGAEFAAGVELVPEFAVLG